MDISVLNTGGGGGGRVSLQWTSISSRGSRNNSSRFMLQKPHMSARMMGHLARMQTLPFTLFSEYFLFKVKH